MKAKEIRDLTAEEIAQKLDEAQHELMNLSLQKVTGQLEKSSRVREVRRGIARLKTIAAEKAK